MSTIITILIVLAAIILILVVLIQKSKGGGLSSNFSSSNAIMGVRKTTDFIEKLTWGLAGFIIVMSIINVMITPKMTHTGPQSEIQLPTVPAANQATPDFGTGLPAPTSTPAPAAPTAPAPTENAN